MSFSSQQKVERKILAILKVLSVMQKPVGSVVIAKHLKERGVDISERAVRYHLRLTDERGLTELVRDRDGRIITDKGLHEIQSALVNDKVGLSISHIEQLAYRSNIDLKNKSGMVPVNVSFIYTKNFRAACDFMIPVFEKGLCVSELVSVTQGGEYIGEILVPEDCTGIATVCSIALNSAFLKAGIPVESRFGGILQMRDGKPVRFTEMIHYSGSSLDPSEIFIKAKMTSVREASFNGQGEILANFREIPAICQPAAEGIIQDLKDAGFNSIVEIGNISENVCEIDVELNKIGMVLIGGLNPVAAAAEAGIESDNYSMSTIIDYSKLNNYKEVLHGTS
jgi:HTH-type transcriptional regulator, global nitrogen regulator NrpRI